MNAWTDTKSSVFVYIFIWKCLLNDQKCNWKWVEMAYHSWSTAYLPCFIVLFTFFTLHFFIWTHSPPYLVFFAAWFCWSRSVKSPISLCLKIHSHPHLRTNTLIQYNDKPLHYETISSQSVQLSDLLSWVFTHGRAHTEASTAQNSPFLFFLLPFTSWVHSAKKERRERKKARDGRENGQKSNTICIMWLLSPFSVSLTITSN